MRPRWLAAVLVAMSCGTAARAGELFDDDAMAFLRRVDADRASLMAVQYKGRIGVMDTFARDMVSQTCGQAGPDGVPPAVAFLELFFNAGDYLTRPVIYVQETKMRKLVAGELGDKALEEFQRTRRMYPAELINEDAAFELLLAGRATPTQCLVSARNTPLGRALAGLSDHPEYRIPLDRLQSRFSTFLAIGGFRPLPIDSSGTWALAEEVLNFDVPLPGSRMPTRLVLEHRVFRPMLQAQRSGDAAKAAELAGMLRETLQSIEEVRAKRLAQESGQRAPATQPAEARPFELPRGEHLACYRDFVGLRDAWRARDAAKVNQLLARLDTDVAKAAARAYPSATFRRFEVWYNHTYSGTVVWIGFAAALVLFIVAAATPQRRAWRFVAMTVFSLSTAASVAGFVVRWIVSGRAWYLPPVMNQFEAVVGSAMLAAVLAIILELAWKKNYFALSAAFYATVTLLCGFFLPEQIGAAIKAQPGILSSPIMAVHVAVIIVGHALVGMTFLISLVYVSVAAVRGIPTEAGRCSTGPDLAAAAGEATLAVVDRCNLIVAQLACWSVAVGTILGAYWADFAWARWWGWDRKETWALITTLVYVAVLHVRFVTPTRWRGTVTACGCIVGCGVMIFNWIIVNYVLPGLHSYA